MLLPQYWGKEYGGSIAKAMVQQARLSKLKRLTAIIDPSNIPSRKILINLGFESQKLCEIDGLPGEILFKALETENC